MIYRFLFLACYLSSFSLFSQELDRSKSALLWEISGNGLKENSYLFGTFHSNDKRLFVFPDSVLWALHTAKGVVLETDITGLMDDIDIRNSGYNPSQVSEKIRYTISKKRVSSSGFREETGRPQFIDLYFQRVSENCNKPVYTLEDVSAQLELISPDISYTVDEAILDKLKTELTPEKLKQAYLRGDILELLELTKNSASVFEGFYEQLILNRNDLMTVGIDSLIRKESLFCAVGAAHLAGQRGILAQLKRKGFEVRRMIPVYNPDTLDHYFSLLKSCEGYRYSDTLFSFNLNLPGKPKVYKENNQLELFFEEWGQGNLYMATVYKNDKAMSKEELIKAFFTNDKGRELRFKERQLKTGICIYEAFVDRKDTDSHWIRVINVQNATYALYCTGGYKFLHSQRPKAYFDGFSLNK